MGRKITLKEEPSKEIKEELKKYPNLLNHLLFSRGIKTLTEAESFLNLDYEEGIFNPFLIKGMQIAVERLLEAIQKNHKVMIYSDYDADGIPGAVILNDFFKKIGFLNFQNYIPNRLQEGYGLNTKAVEKFISERVEVLITIDCGITNITEIKLAQDKGIDVILTDHHLVNGGELPPALVILNSKQAGDDYPDEMLCGAGVVFKLIQALIEKGDFGIVKGWEKWLLDMVGLATIADMVPLKKENRIFAKYGLLVMKKSPRVGLMKLLRKMKVDQKFLTEDDISFMLAPRINAASRVADPRIAFDLFSTGDEVIAGKLADQLDKLNNQRKTLMATAVREAKRKIKEKGLKEMIVVGHTDWNLGLSGLIASSLKDFYKRPCFVWGTDEQGHYCGSCRSETIDLMKLMNLVEEGVFAYCGGHRFAGGFGIVSEQIYFLEEKLLQAWEKIADKNPVEEIFVDKKLSLEDINWENYKYIEQLAPFGPENPKPLFLFENIRIMQIRVFGKTSNHLELVFANGNQHKIKAIDFFSQKIKDKKSSLQMGDSLSFLANFEKNVFGGKNELRLRIVEII